MVEREDAHSFEYVQSGADLAMNPRATAKYNDLILQTLHRRTGTTNGGHVQRS